MGSQKLMLLITEEEPSMDINHGPFTAEATEDTEASVLLMLTLGMAVMVVMDVVLLLITEVVHLTSDPLSGVLEERSVMLMLMLTLGMAVMVAMDVVLPLIPEVVHLTSDPLSGVLEER